MDKSDFLRRLDILIGTIAVMRERVSSDSYEYISDELKLIKQKINEFDA